MQWLPETPGTLPSMQLRDALAVGDRDVVAFVGAGGKTTSLFRLAGELAAAGCRVVTTTTTRIFAEQMRHAAYVIIREQLDEILARLPAVLREHGAAMVVSGIVDSATRAVRNAGGIPPEWVEAIASVPEVDAIVIEADGSRGRAFKAPAEHEPVVPECTTVLVPVVGIDVLGRPLTAQHVHRPKQVVRLADATIGQTITPEMIARVIAASQGGCRRRPAGARCVPLINKVETPQQQTDATTIARAILDHGTVDAVCIGAVARPDPILRVLRP